jgi:hypothetical protein
MVALQYFERRQLDPAKSVDGDVNRRWMDALIRDFV